MPAQESDKAHAEELLARLELEEKKPVPVVGTPPADSASETTAASDNAAASTAASGAAVESVQVAAHECLACTAVPCCRVPVALNYDVCAL